uniref:Ska2 N-terminal domain-containing protein n=1 Tax=Oncorhynchus mykiss TaxID=8022 RepID=A0A8C7NJC9_ONCMY
MEDIFCRILHAESQFVVDKLEAMFQKAQVDMEYIEKQLRLDFLTNAPGNAPPSQNPLEKVGGRRFMYCTR